MNLSKTGLALALAASLAAFGCAHFSKPKAPAERPVNTGQGRTLAEIALLPDWGGVWDPAPAARPKPGDPPAKPAAQAQLTPKYAALKAVVDKKAAVLAKANKRPGLVYTSNVANCLPYGLPVSMRLPYPIEFLFTPGRVTIGIETDSMVRRIYTDGRPMPDDPDPTYQGTSVGHWEGDTLVVETSAINPTTSVISGIDGHGPDLHVTERMKLVGPDRLQIETTLTDPEVFAAPYTTTTTYQRHRDWTIMEYICAQNNHDGVDANGNATFDLTRKPGE